MEPAVTSAEGPTRGRTTPRALVTVAVALGVAVLVAVIYRDAARSYFVNDDFQWLQGAPAFTLERIVHIERYDHFYRPVIELYFHAGRRLFGCDAFSFHVLSLVIHLLNTLLLFLFGRALTKSDTFGALAALFFAVQPGHAEAVAWICAVCDLLPATWFLLAVWTHLLFLERRKWWLYAVSLAAMMACLLTHESSATLLPTMLLLEATVAWKPVNAWSAREIAARSVKYIPFAILLAGYLAIAYDVNTRSYVVRDGHYQLGWHAVRHVIHYLITLYMGSHGRPAQAGVAAVVVALLVRGTPRVRFFTLWMLVTLLPASFFTWSNVSRYLYLPAAGFSLLAAEAAIALRSAAARFMSPQTARVLVIAVTTLFAVRSALLATPVLAGLRDAAGPYERYVAAVREAKTKAPGAGTIYLESAVLNDIPAIYRDPAAEVASCDGFNVHVLAR